MIRTHRYEAPVEEPVTGKLVEIETTGLRPERSQITVISVAETRGNILHTTQWIATAKDDEGALLTRALPVINHSEITVFHAPFLVPFLAARAERVGLTFAPKTVTDLRSRLVALKPFFPLEKTSRSAIADTLELPLPEDPNGEDIARLTRRLYKQYDKTVADRIAAHNLLHMQALCGMAQFWRRWHRYLTRSLPFFTRPVLLHEVVYAGDFLTCTFIVRNENPAFLAKGPVELTVRPRRAIFRIEVQQGMITETMPCLFAEIFDFPSLADTTGFRVPEGILLLQVEDRFLPDSIFSLLQALLEAQAPAAVRPDR